MKRIRNYGWLGLVLFGLCVSAPAPAPAVEVNPDGEGQVLILPLWTTTGGHSTLVHLYPAQMVRLRLLDASGSVVLNGNLYTYSGVWTAGIGARSGGGSRLHPGANGCLLIESEGGVVPASAPLDIDADYGSAEVIVMGTTDSGVSGTPGDEVRQLIADQDCDGLAARWNSGAWATDPDNGLAAEYPSGPPLAAADWSIINVERGVLFDVPDTALVHYSDRTQHTTPGSELPNLASGHDSGTDNAMTHSRNCSAGNCREDTWPTALDAMAAALMTGWSRGDYAIDPNLGASTDAVFHFPLVPYFTARQGAEPHPLSEPRIWMAVFDRLGQGQLPLICPGLIPPGETCNFSVWRAEEPTQLQTLSFNTTDGGDPGVSSLLGIPDSYGPETWVGDQSAIDSLATLGTFSIWFSEDLNGGATQDEYQELTSNESTRYFGAPVLPVVFQQFVNGTLQGEDGVPQRANYSKAFAPTRR
ncbi:MAG: hypothetical protein R3F22_08065 [Lysobacteraceae bacterium]